ncbi:MAG: helix-turn-helix domain-containing protein [Phycisphaerae bacterium]
MRETDFTRRFSELLRAARIAGRMSQEQLASRAGIHRTHVSLIERSRRTVRLETLERLARALDIEPAQLIPPASKPGATISAKHHPDIKTLQNLFPFIRQYQDLASKHGIHDIFQDNGGKLLQTLLILRMEGLGRREGNDCHDADGNEYELKSVNISLTKLISTHHHLNPEIIKKYRKVKAWYFSVYRGIELVEILRVETRALEKWFKAQEKKWHESNGRDLNNPKIPLSLVQQVGTTVFKNNDNKIRRDSA